MTLKLLPRHQLTEKLTKNIKFILNKFSRVSVESEYFHLSRYVPSSDKNIMSKAHSSSEREIKGDYVQGSSDQISND